MKEIAESINPNNINNITLTKGYEEIYKYCGMGFKVRYKSEDTGVIFDEKKLFKKIKTEIELGLIHNDSGWTNNIDVLLYYNSFITIKYNDCCEKNIYFDKYENALEYFNKLNEKLGFINFLNL